MFKSYDDWLVVSTPLKNMNVNWDSYSQYMGKMFQTTNQMSYVELTEVPHS